MIDFRPILFMIGVILLVLAAAMIIPVAADLLGDADDWLTFVLSALITAFVGALLTLTNRSESRSLSLRQAFLLCAGGWVAASIFSALPFILSPLGVSFVDAVFEAVSGFTTTGVTVLDEQTLRRASDGIFMWRALLQWLGGIGIVVMGCTMLPALRIGGMQIFRTENTNPDSRITPGAPRFVVTLCFIYAGVTAFLIAGLLLAGVNGLEAVCQAMGAISTGGFSTRDGLVSSVDSLTVDLVLTTGMLIGAMSFPLYVMMARGKWSVLAFDQQIRLFLGLILIGGVITTLWLWLDYGMTPGYAVRHGFFSAVSVVSGTGFHSLDFGIWPTVPATVLFFLMFVGGCSGSTASGVKIFRLHILTVNAVAQISRILRPHAVAFPYYNRQPIPDSIVDSVMGFLFVYFLTLAALVVSLGLLGIDFVTALTAAASTLSNVGISAGPMMQAGGGFSFLPDTAKWILSAAMLLGRLELFTFLVLLIPAFWKP